MKLWSKKIRKIVDISVACAAGVTILTYGACKLIPSYKDHVEYARSYDEALQAAKDAMKDETGHIPVDLPQVDPTEYECGYTAGKKDKETGEIYEGHKVIPMLNYKDYKASSGTKDGKIVITWEITDEARETYGLTEFTAKELTFNSVHTDKDMIKVNGSNCLPFQVMNKFPGIEVTYDRETATLIWNVVKEGGVVIEKSYFSTDTNANINLLIKGQPLTILAVSGYDAINLDTNSCNLTVENELTVHTPDYVNITQDKSGICAKTVTVAETGCLRVYNMNYGFYVKEALIVNGELDVSGNTKALYNFSGKNIEVGENRKLYVKEQLKTVTDNKFPFSSVDKHLSICKSETNIEDFVSYKVLELTDPTLEAAGSVTFTCVGCGTTKKTFELPALNGVDYEEEEGSVIVDGKEQSVSCFIYHPTLRADDLVFDLRQNLDSFFVVGDKYYTVEGWNADYDDVAPCARFNGTFSISLSDDVTFDLSDAAGGIDLTLFDEVYITGTGTLKIITNQKTALKAKKLDIGKNVILELDGTNCSKSAYTVEDRDGLFDGIVATESLTLNGKTNITNFYVGILTNGTCNISASADVSITKTIYGVYSNAATTLTSNGKLTFTNTASATKYTTAVGLYSYRSAVTYHFTGNSETTITTGNQGLGTVDSNSANNVTLRASGSAKLTLRATNTGTTNYAVSNINHFIVANDNDAECNATVSLIANSSAAMNYLTLSSADHSFIVNSTGDVVLWKDGSKVSQNGVNFNAGKYDFKILSNVKIQRFDYAMNFSSVTVKSAVCDHKVVTNVPNFACNHNFKGTLPAGITEAGWVYTEE